MATPKPTLNPMNAEPALIFAATTVAILLGLYQLYVMGNVNFFSSIYFHIQIQKLLKGKDAEKDRRKRYLDHKARKADERLKRHSEEFSTKTVVRVADDVYVAIGYGLANCIMIEGKVLNIVSTL